ncbi:MAG: hypothetical protein ACJ8F7_00290 [Gemmataceae bacterium]
MFILTECKNCGKRRKTDGTPAGGFVCRECQVQQLRVVTGIKRFGSVVSNQQFVGVLEKVRENTLSPEQLKLFVQVAPQFVEFQRQTIDCLKKVAEGAKASQQSAFQTIGGLNAVSQALAELARSAQTDETRLEIAKLTVETVRLQTDVARIVETMNKDNNNFWRWLGGAAIGAAFGALGVTAAVLLSGGKSNSRS